MEEQDLIEQHLDEFVDWVHNNKDFIASEENYEQDLEDYIECNKKELWAEFAATLPEQ